MNQEAFLQDLAKVIPSINFDQQQRRQPRQPPVKRGTSIALLRPSAEGLVAKSLLAACPSPFLPPLASSQGHEAANNQARLSEIEWDEEGQTAHWPVDDEAIFYRTHRLTPSADGSGRRNFFDLHIVMPLVIPGSQIRVVNGDGENYCHFPSSEPGPHILFGRNRNHSHNDQLTQPSTDDPNFRVKPPPVNPPYPSVCDIWATFLNVHLGTIRNLRSQQVLRACELFNKALLLDQPAPTFISPVSIQCQGIYPFDDKIAVQQSPNCDRYNTHATFLHESDRKRFRILRRRIKRFILTLWEEFGLETEGPRFSATLTDSCRTREDDVMYVEIRRYTPLSDADLLKNIWTDQNRTSGKLELAGLPPIVASARAILNEVRLEMTHARMVDPRWSDQWVLSRRMPASPGTVNGRRQLARFVFCERVELPPVIYEFGSPRKTLLNSRFAPLYLLAAVARKEESDENKDKDTGRLSAAAVPFYPISDVLNKLAAVDAGSSLKDQQQTTSGATGGQPLVKVSTAKMSPWERFLTSATLSGVTNGSNSNLNFLSSNRLFTPNFPSQKPFSGQFDFNSIFSPMTYGSPFASQSPYNKGYPLTGVVCKFYQVGSCARGDSCFFLHPADPKMSSTSADIRQLTTASPLGASEGLSFL